MHTRTFVIAAMLALPGLSGLAPAQTAAPAAPGAPASAIGMAEAIAAAERHSGEGARAIEAEFEEAKGSRPAHYEIKVFRGDGRLVEHLVGAGDGAVLQSEDQRPRGLLSRIAPGDVGAMRVSLREAVTLAERQIGPGARAVEAEIERERGALGFEIEVARDGRTIEVKVAADGAVRVEN